MPSHPPRLQGSATEETVPEISGTGHAPLSLSEGLGEGGNEPVPTSWSLERQQRNKNKKEKENENENNILEEVIIPDTVPIFDVSVVPNEDEEKEYAEYLNLKYKDDKTSEELEIYLRHHTRDGEPLSDEEKNMLRDLSACGWPPQGASGFAPVLTAAKTMY